MACASDKQAIWSRLHALTQLSDFTITNGESEWQVHRLVLSAHSKVLEKACTNGFQESAQKTLDLSEYDTDLIDGLVEYMYHFDYESSMAKHHANEGLPAYHVRMFIVADKYIIEPLKRIALEKFKRAIEETTANEFANAARYAYGAALATKDICKEIVRKAVENQEIGINFEKKTELEDVMADNPELAVAIAKACKASTSLPQIEKPASPKMSWFRCPHPSCGRRFQFHIPANEGMYRCAKCGFQAIGNAWQFWKQVA